MEEEEMSKNERMVTKWVVWTTRKCGKFGQL